MDLLEKNDARVQTQTEKCVLCGKDTHVFVNQYIGSRNHYIVGAGQLCNDCF